MTATNTLHLDLNLNLSLASASLALALTLLAWPSAAHACSLAFDWAEPPLEERAYDEALAPAAPVVESATARYFYSDEQVAGCTTVSSSCGDYSSVRVQLTESPAFDRIRITYDDGRVDYARPMEDFDGQIAFTMPWGKEDSAPEGVIWLAVIDDQGYPSLEVELMPVIEGVDSGGCTAGKRSSVGMFLMLLMALFIVRYARIPRIGPTERAATAARG